MNESERLTRKKRIDSKLRSLNPKWQIVPFCESMDCSELTNHVVEEYPTEDGFADYALFVKGRLLGFIEAKKVAVNPLILRSARRA